METNRIGASLDGESSPDKVPWILVAALAIITAMVLLLPESKFLCLFHDDSFFYIKTANNFSRGLGATFDGINMTNGFHPLYFLVLAAAAKVAPLTGWTGMAVVFIVDSVFLLLALLFWNRLLWRHNVSFASRLAFVMLTLFFLALNDCGMEARLLLALVGAYLLVLDRATQSLSSVSTLAVLGIGICLARLEMFMLVVIAVLVCVALPASQQKRWKFAVVGTMIAVVPPLLSLAGYAAVNMIFFGHPNSVSSSLKTGFPGTFTPGINWFQSSILGVKARFLFCAAVSLATVPICLWRVIRRRDNLSSSRLELLLLALGLYVLGYSMALLLFSRSAPGSWYFMVPLTFTFLVFVVAWDNSAWPRLARAGGEKLARFAAALAIIAILTGGVAFLAAKFVSTSNDDVIKISRWITENLPPDARIFMVDGSGKTGYFSERSVINGDGLINSFEYRDYLRSGRLKQYLSNKRVGYLAYNHPFATERLAIRIPLAAERRAFWVFEPHPRILARFGRLSVFRITPEDVENSRLE